MHAALSWSALQSRILLMMLQALPVLALHSGR